MNPRRAEARSPSGAGAVRGDPRKAQGKNLLSRVVVERLRYEVIAFRVLENAVEQLLRLFLHQGRELLGPVAGRGLPLPRLAVDKHVEGVDGRSEGVAVSVEDGAPRRTQNLAAGVLRLGLKDVVLVADYLKIGEAPDQTQAACRKQKT
jgi:hypothetical protein